MIELSPAILVNERCKREEMEQSRSEYYFRSSWATRYRPDTDDPRPPFSHDIDRILYSKAYTRYIDKTQVFYLIENDHITHRVLHVQLVSKIARTIGRYLMLNEDLIEAVSLGHDVGHTPFGHNGESLISRFCERHDCGRFEHNVQSFRQFYEVEKGGQGLNLSVQVLDGIICHNGELVPDRLVYDAAKTPGALLQQYHDALAGRMVSADMVPMTLEGCVMRISDVIAYVGRDIDDAVEVRLISRDDIPHHITDVLGRTTRDIVNTLVADLVNNSFGRDYLRFSPAVGEALQQLKAWNYEHIYLNTKKQVQDGMIAKMFDRVMEVCLEEVETGRDTTQVNTFLSTMGDEYRANPAPRIVADFVAGMTDDFLLNTYRKMTIPHSFGMGF